MKKIILLLSTLWLTQILFAQNQKSEKLIQLMENYASINKFNGTVLVAEKGEILIEKGYGFGNAEKNIPNNSKSLFHIYSITKSFTSTLILKLVELKKMSLDDKLSKYYPEIPFGDSISIKQLLSHTAGIPNYAPENSNPDFSEHAIIQFLTTTKPEYTAGTSWAYSNTGYSLLGFISAKVSGLSYEKAIRKYIFSQIGMNQSGFDYLNLIDNQKTVGYSTYNEVSKIPVMDSDSTGPFAAGAIYSTVGDLHKFHKSLQQNVLISKESQELAYTPIKNNYGFGWIIEQVNGKKMVSHSGGYLGYRTNFARIIEDDICIILLSNNENSNLPFITQKILMILNGQEVAPIKEVILPVKELPKYEGYFSLNPQVSVHIYQDGIRLAANATGQGKTMLHAQNENDFLIEEISGGVTFLKDATGKINAIEVNMRGNKMHADKYLPSWGLVGSSVANGWEGPDLSFSEDPTKKGHWILKNISLSSGEIKVRFNNDWEENYGDNNADGILEKFGNNIKVEKGAYDISLDFENVSGPTLKIMPVK